MKHWIVIAAFVIAMLGLLSQQRPVAAAGCLAPRWEPSRFPVQVQAVVGDRDVMDVSVDTGTEPVRYTIEAGALPAGEFLVPAAGLVVGAPRPAALGAPIAVQYRATNACGSALSPVQTQLVLPQVAFNAGDDPSVPFAHLRVARLYDWHTEFGGPIEVIGQLPPGMTADLRAGTITGIPTRNGLYLFTVVSARTRIPLMVTVVD